MTTPNHLTPDGSITGYGSWPTVQARTRDEWEAGEYQKWANAMAGIPKIGDKLAEIPVIGGALSDFWEIITGIPDSDENDAGSIIRGFFDGISSALSGSSNPNPGDSFLTNVWQLLGGLKTQTADNAAAIQQLENLLSASAPTPAWVSNLTDMASVPRALLIPLPSSTASASVSVSGTTGSGGASGGAHTHSFSDSTSHSHSLTSSMPSFKPTANNVAGNSTGSIYFTPIIADRTGKLDKLRFITGPDSLLYSIDEYYLALFGYNPMNGNLEKLWQSDNLKNNIGDDRAEIEISMGLNATVQPAQILFVAHMQRQPSLGGSTRRVAAVLQPGVSRPSSVLLRASCYQLNSQTGIAASYSLSSLSMNNDYIPWYAISVTN
ncbi:minor tail protein [Gordonia phage Yummy]|nr:minor tail protein [Gordonia phage Yummy]